MPTQETIADVAGIAAQAGAAISTAKHIAATCDNGKALGFTQALLDVLNRYISAGQLTNGEYSMGIARFVATALMGEADDNHRPEMCTKEQEDRMHGLIHTTLVQGIVYGCRHGEAQAKKNSN